MSGSTGTGKPDQRDLDDELLSRTPAPRTPPTSPDGPPPNMLSMPLKEDSALQRELDKVTGGGLYPHWDNRDDQRRPDAGCVVYESGGRCRYDGAWKAWIGCPSEHIAASDICEHHMPEIERAKFGWRCSLCWDATGTVVLAYFIRKEPLAHADLGRS